MDYSRLRNHLLTKQAYDPMAGVGLSPAARANLPANRAAASKARELTAEEVRQKSKDTHEAYLAHRTALRGSSDAKKKPLFEIPSWLQLGSVPEGRGRRALMGGGLGALLGAGLGGFGGVFRETFLEPEDEPSDYLRSLLRGMTYGGLAGGGVGALAGSTRGAGELEQNIVDKVKQKKEETRKYVKSVVDDALGAKLLDLDLGLLGRGNISIVDGYRKGAACLDEKLLKWAAGPAWTRAEGKNPEGGLNAKGRASYKAQTGGTLRPPVSKERAEKSPKDAKRRASFCARSDGQRRMHNIDCSADPEKRICKARAKWDC